MGPEESFDLIELLIGMSRAMDRVSPRLDGHQLRTAWVASRLGLRMELPRPELLDLVLASLLHDCGALSLKERLLLHGTEPSPLSAAHAERGHRLLRRYAPLAAAAEMVRWHHLPWDQRAEEEELHGAIPRGAQILHLADRCATLLERDQEPLGQSGDILARLREESGSRFWPEAIAALDAEGAAEGFWLTLAWEDLAALVKHEYSPSRVGMDWGSLFDLSRLVSELVDFRSRYTAMHSRSVAAAALAIARQADMAPHDCRSIAVAGYLHDVGKLVVPLELLDKPAALTPAEFAIVRSHGFWGYRILDGLPALRQVKLWGALHHERLDGLGYPFRLDGEELQGGTRILGVADIYTALTEPRPYREGMAPGVALDLLAGMAQRGVVDERVLAWLRASIEVIDEARDEARAEVRRATTELGMVPAE